MKPGFTSAILFGLLAGCIGATMDPSNMSLDQKEKLYMEHCVSVKKHSADLCESALQTTKRVAGDDYEIFMTYASIGFLMKLGTINRDHGIEMKNRMIDENPGMIDLHNKIGNRVNEAYSESEMNRYP